MLLKTAASGEIRDNHWVLNPVTNIYERTTLLEPAHTNLVTSDDIDGGWTSVGTPVVTASISDPAAGTGAYRLADDSGAAAESKFLAVTFTGDGVKSAVFVVREATMPASGTQSFDLYDTIAAANRARATITAWVDGKPSVTMTAGTLLGQRAVGDGYWAIYVQSASVTAANAHRIYAYPAGTTSATGSIDIYRMNAYNATVPPQSILDASETTTADNLYIPFAAVPQEMTVYARFFEGGAAKMAASAIVWQIGTGATTKIALCGQVSGSGAYEFKWHNAATTAVFSSVAPTPDIGDLVELRCVLFASGAVQIHQSVNGAVETSGTKSAALALESAWLNERMYVGGDNGTVVGINAFAHKGGVRAWPGVLTLKQCRTLAGVS